MEIQIKVMKELKKNEQIIAEKSHELDLETHGLTIQPS